MDKIHILVPSISSYKDQRPGDGPSVSRKTSENLPVARVDNTRRGNPKIEVNKTISYGQDSGSFIKTQLDFVLCHNSFLLSQMLS